MALQRITVFTDGASSGNPGPGGWGCILVQGQDHVVELGGGENPTTNNRMELMAAIEALGAIAQRGWPGRIEIYTDSKYVIQGITQWIKGWMARGWVTANGKEVLNRDLWEALEAKVRELGSGLPISWYYVPGHEGVVGNERADAIAVSYSKDSGGGLYEGPLSKYGHPGLLDVKGTTVGRGGISSKSKKKGKAWYLSFVSGQLKKHTTWGECQQRVHGMANAKYKKVSSEEEEAQILKQWGVT